MLFLLCFPLLFVACVFESKWKALTKRVPHKNQNGKPSQQSEDLSRSLLQHRQEALNKVKISLECTNLEINWHLDLIWFNYYYICIWDVLFVIMLISHIAFSLIFTYNFSLVQSNWGNLVYLKRTILLPCFIFLSLFVWYICRKKLLNTDKVYIVLNDLVNLETSIFI